MTKKETWSIFPQYVKSWKNKRDAIKINRGINSNQNKFMNNTPTTVKFDIATIVPTTKYIGIYINGSKNKTTSDII